MVTAIASKPAYITHCDNGMTCKSPLKDTSVTDNRYPPSLCDPKTAQYLLTIGETRPNDYTQDTGWALPE